MFILLLIFTAMGKVKVFSPDQLRSDFEEKYSDGVIKASIGNFGNPAYGTTILGKVYLPEKASELDGCLPISPIQFENDPSHAVSPIIMLDRGQCYFVIKVRHAQDIGARLVVIVNNNDGDVQSMIMTDNGFGGNLDIPAVLISQEDGILIKKYIKNKKYSEKVSLSISFDMKKASGKVKVSFFSSPTSESGRRFMFDFKDYGSKFTKENLDFIPHYMLWYCPKCEESNYQTDHPDCISGGRYCSFDPDNEGILTGRDVMYEDLRQMCLYKYLRYNKSYNKWFKYHSEYYMQCSDKIVDKKCSEDIFKSMNIKPKSINDCVNVSFAGKNPIIDDNLMMREEHDHLLQNYLPFYPSIVINEQIYKGDLEAVAVFEAICAGYDYGTAPDFCGVDYDKDKNGEKESGYGTVFVVVVVILCFGLVAGILVVYRMIVKKDLNRDMRVQVNSAVAQYFQLAEMPEGK